MMFCNHPGPVGEQTVDVLKLLQLGRGLLELEARVEPGPDLRTRARWKTRRKFCRVTRYEFGTRVSSRSLKIMIEIN